MFTVAFAASALAGNWGAGGWAGPSVQCDEGTVESECTPDDDFHRVYIDSDVHSSFESAFTASLAQDYDTNTGIVALIDTTLDEDTDVRIRDVDIDDDLDFIMYTTCAVGATHGGGTGYYEWCRRQLIRIDKTQPGFNSCVNSATCRNFYACHELGHTLGLQHPGTYPNVNGSRETCMDFDDDDKPDVHDRDHLADCFPRPGPAPATLTPLCENYDVYP